jgi:hypothetical protein
MPHDVDILDVLIGALQAAKATQSNAPTAHIAVGAAGASRKES